MSQHNRIDSFKIINVVTDYHPPHLTLSLKGLNISLVIFILNSLNLIQQDVGIKQIKKLFLETLNL